MSKVKYERNRQIDGLKGFAMLLVIIYHFFYRYPEIYSQENVSRFPFISKFGVIGVTIFFVISGYFMSGSSTGGYRLIKKKVIRLWPVYAISITLCFLLTRCIYLPDRTVGFRDYLLNLVWVNGVINTPYVDGAHWYITDLFGCIIVYAFLNQHSKKHCRTILVCLSIVISITCKAFADNLTGGGVIKYSVSIIDTLTGSGRISMVYAGEVVAILGKKHYKEAVFLELLSIFLCIYRFSFLYTITLVAAQVLMFLVANQKIKPFSLRPISIIGEASYSIYVFHQNIGFVIIYTFSTILRGYSLIYSCIAFIAMTIWGLIAFKYLEVSIGNKIAALEGR